MLLFFSSRTLFNNFVSIGRKARRNKIYFIAERLMKILSVCDRVLFVAAAPLTFPFAGKLSSHHFSSLSFSVNKL
jgi:hypothetical protein